MDHRESGTCVFLRFVVEKEKSELFFRRPLSVGTVNPQIREFYYPCFCMECNNYHHKPISDEASKKKISFREEIILTPYEEAIKAIPGP